VKFRHLIPSLYIRKSPNYLLLNRRMGGKKKGVGKRSLQPAPALPSTGEKGGGEPTLSSKGNRLLRRKERRRPDRHPLFPPGSGEKRGKEEKGKRGRQKKQISLCEFGEGRRGAGGSSLPTGKKKGKRKIRSRSPHHPFLSIKKDKNRLTSLSPYVWGGEFYYLQIKVYVRGRKRAWTASLTPSSLR